MGKRYLIAILIVCITVAILAILAYGATVNLKWTAPADDDAIVESGPVAFYEIKWSTSPITDENYDSIINTFYKYSPNNPGEEETFTLSVIDGYHYWFAVKSIDDADNISGLSNVVEHDFFPPAPIINLQ